jgi:trk system potassium uptake protein TrkH
MPAWDALNHAMTGLATGGFVVTDTSFKAYGEVVRMAALPMMFVGAIPLPAYYLLFKADFSAVYSDIQVRWLFVLIIGGTLAVLGTLLTHAIYPLDVRGGTGSDLPVRLGDLLYGLLYCREHRAQMAVGSGTRVNDGDGIGWGLRLDGERNKGHPGDQHHSRGSRTDPGPLPREGALGLDRRVGLRTTFLGELPQRLAGRLPMGGNLPAGGVRAARRPADRAGTGGVPVGNVSFTVASAQGNVGLTSGIVTPSSPTLPGSAKLALTANMWIGRLEVVPMLVFLRGLFWDVEAESE